jgi:hypothetical protein
VNADEIFPVTAGGVKFSIPVPEQFAEVGDRKQVFPEGTGNRLLAWFVPAADIKEGKSSSRWMQVQSLKKLEDHVLTAAEFTQLKEITDKQQEQLYAAAKEELDGILKKASSGEGAVQLKMGQVKPLGIFMKGDSAFGMLMLMGLEAKAADGKSVSDTVYCAANFLRVNDRLLYAYAYCSAQEKDAMEWVKVTSERWVKEIQKANTK